MKAKGVKIKLFGAVAISSAFAMLSFLLFWVIFEPFQFEYIESPALYNNFTYIYLLLSATIFFITFFVSIKSRINYINQLAHELKKGNERVSIKGNDEITELARNINSMRDKIDYEREDKQSLISSLSHDLRTPLTSIIGYLELLKSSTTDTQQTQYIDKAYNKARHLANLQFALFEYIKYSDTQFEPNLESIDVSVFMMQSLTESILDFESRSITVQHKNIEHAQVEVDILLLQRIFDNLFSNGNRYAKTYFSTNIECVDCLCVITLENDTDEKMDIKQVFNRFYTGEESRNVGGTGLGLPIVEAAVKKMNGTISAILLDNVFKVEITFQCVLQKSSEKSE